MIILQFVRGADFGAAAIQWFSHGVKVSHVDTVMPNGFLFGARSDCVGGAPAGVWARDPSYVSGCATLRIELPCSDAVASAYLALVTAEEGKPYDSTAIAAFAIDRDWQAKDSWFCSELVAYALERCGYFALPLAAPANKITPADLLLALSVKVPLPRIIEPPPRPKPAPLYGDSPA